MCSVVCTIVPTPVMYPQHFSGAYHTPVHGENHKWSTEGTFIKNGRGQGSRLDYLSKSSLLEWNILTSIKKYVDVILPLPRVLLLMRLSLINGNSIL